MRGYLQSITRTLLSHRRDSFLYLIGCIAIGFCASQSAAQDTAATTTLDNEQMEEVVVTGTSIRGVAPVGSNLIQLDQQQMQQTGLANAADVLKSIPQVTNLGFDESRTDGAQRAIANLVGNASINLRGLGVEATLVLINGHRPLPSGGEGRYFDPNSLPSIALQRVEVVPDGSSAIYGSDAMTGVVNLITRRQYDGADVRLRYGGADGYDQYQIQGLFGHEFANGNIVFATEYYDRGNLETKDRPDLYDDSSVLTTRASPPNFGASGFVDANNDGFLDPGEATGNPPNTQSNWLGVDVLPTQERRSFYLAGDIEASDALTFYGDAYYTKRDFTRNLKATELVGRSTSPVVVPASNPYNLTGADTANISYSFINSLGPLYYKGYEEVWQATGGVTLTLGGEWQLDGYVSYGEVDDYRTRTGRVNGTALVAALNSTDINTALDVFSNGTNGYPSGQVRQNVLSSINGYDLVNPTVNIFDVRVGADGPIFELPTGEARLAIGAEYVAQEREQILKNNYVTPNTNTVATTRSPTIERKVDSIFSELFLPIIESNSGQRVTATLAVRYDRYDDTQSGPSKGLLDTSTTNPKIGVNWDISDTLSLRASYGTSFRAPSLGDYTYGAPTVVAPPAISPQLAAIYSIPLGPPPPASVMIQGGHNLGLDPEEADTWTFGMDFKSGGLNLSATYYNIQFENQIAVPANANSLQEVSYAQTLANSGSSLVLPGQGLIIFNPTTAQLQAYLAHGGSATAHINVFNTPEAVLYGSGSAPVSGQTTPVYVLIESLSTNSGTLETDGIDFSASYGWDTNAGSWVIGDTFTYVLNYDLQLAKGTPFVDYLNQVDFPLQFQSRAYLSWNRGSLSANVFANYQNAYNNTKVSPTKTVDSNLTFDVKLSYDTGDNGSWMDNTVVSLTALNIFDEDPPFAQVSQGVALQNFDSQNASPIGRYVGLEIAKHW